MNPFLLKQYLPLLKKEHILAYASSISFPISEEEADIILSFIQENIDSLLQDNTTILSLKPLLREDLFQKIQDLYYENKTKYFS